MAKVGPKSPPPEGLNKPARQKGVKQQSAASARARPSEQRPNAASILADAVLEGGVKNTYLLAYKKAVKDHSQLQAALDLPNEKQSKKIGASEAHAAERLGNSQKRLDQSEDAFNKTLAQSLRGPNGPKNLRKIFAQSEAKGVSQAGAARVQKALQEEAEKFLSEYESAAPGVKNEIFSRHTNRVFLSKAEPFALARDTLLANNHFEAPKEHRKNLEQRVFEISAFAEKKIWAKPSGTFATQDGKEWKVSYLKSKSGAHARAFVVTSSSTGGTANVPFIIYYGAGGTLPHSDEGYEAKLKDAVNHFKGHYSPRD